MVKKTTLFYIFCFILLPCSFLEAGSYLSLMRKGNRFYKNELYGEALAHFLLGKEKNKKVVEPDFNASAALYKMEDYVRSIESLTEALQKRKKELKAADIYYNLGNNYYKLGDWQNAVQSYIKGLELNPYDLNMKYNLELALKKLKENTQPEKEKTQEEGVENTGKRKEKEGQPSPQDNNAEKKTTTEASPGRGALGSTPGSASLSDSPSDAMELSQEEAKRLINSLNTDQAQTIREIIKSRISKETHEKDW
jgi:Ca-activated chloride channel family protein